MKNSRLLLVAATLSALTLAGGCASDAPETMNDQMALQHSSQSVLDKMYDSDTTLRNMIDRSYAYAIFPSVGKGAVIAGGASGRGEVIQQGRLVGYAELNQVTIGAQVGGQDYAELLVFQTPEALANFQTKDTSLSANASAVALKAGASAEAHFENGVAVFTMPLGGLMAEASIGGQSFKYQPASDSDIRMYSSDQNMNPNHNTYHRTETKTTETHTQNP